MEPIAVRAYEPTDLPAVTAILNQPDVVGGTLQRPFTSLADREKRASAGQSPELHIVAEREGRVIGFLTLYRNQHRRGHSAALGMAVDSAFAGQGCGGTLLGAATDHADRWLLVSRLELTVFADNDRAIRLYERHGFEAEGRHRGFALRDGELVDAIAMARLRPAVALRA
ncbi:MAG: GNAT family N-acetyltransferase [Pseudomonadota bacterium]